MTKYILLFSIILSFNTEASPITDQLIGKLSLEFSDEELPRTQEKIDVLRTCLETQERKLKTRGEVEDFQTHWEILFPLLKWLVTDQCYFNADSIQYACDSLLGCAEWCHGEQLSTFVDYFLLIANRLRIKCWFSIRDALGDVHNKDPSFSRVPVIIDDLAILYDARHAHTNDRDHIYPRNLFTRFMKLTDAADRRNVAVYSAEFFAEPENMWSTNIMDLIAGFPMDPHDDSIPSRDTAMRVLKQCMDCVNLSSLDIIALLKLMREPDGPERTLRAVLFLCSLAAEYRKEYGENLLMNFPETVTSLFSLSHWKEFKIRLLSQRSSPPHILDKQRIEWIMYEPVLSINYSVNRFYRMFKAVQWGDIRWD